MAKTTHKGWFRPGLSKKWHYFNGDNMSLCGKWWMPGLMEMPSLLDDTGHDSKQNGTGCKAKREKLSTNG